MLVAIHSVNSHLQAALQQLIPITELQFITILPGGNADGSEVMVIRDKAKYYILDNGSGNETSLDKPIHINILAKTLLVKLGECHYKLSSMIFYPWKRSIVAQNSASEGPISLTEKENDIIHYLMKKGTSGASKKELLNNIWGYNELSETTTVETHIYRLRNKLSAQKLEDAVLSSDNKYYLKDLYLLLSSH